MVRDMLPHHQYLEAKALIATLEVTIERLREIEHLVWHETRSPLSRII